jgi:hypothetical protein
MISKSEITENQHTHRPALLGRDTLLGQSDAPYPPE